MDQKKTNPQIPSFLLDHLTGSANKETYKKYFLARNCSEIRRLLAKEIHERINSSVRKGDNTDKFELPSWPQMQASEVGYRRAMREILDIIER